MAKRGPKIKYKGVKEGRQEFSVPFIEAISRDLQKKGKTDLRVLIDDVTTGLRCYIRNTGRISWHAAYMLEQGKGRGNERPLQKIGEYPEMSLDEARYITSVVVKLGAKGIDIRKGPRPEKLATELREWGEQWTPHIKGARETTLAADLSAATIETARKSLDNQPDTQLILEDTKVPGLRIVMRLREPVRWRVGRVTLGTYPDLSVADARKKAAPLVELLATGAVVED